MLDANVFVSAVLKSTGNLAQIIELIKEGKFTLLVSPDILAEVRATLLYPKLRKLNQRSTRWNRGFLQELSANEPSRKIHLQRDYDPSAPFGRRFFNFAGSDFHNDAGADFWPGEYLKT